MNNPTPYKSTTAVPIPFREEPAVSAKQMVSTFAITLLLLGVLWMAASYARRKGWLDRWLTENRSSDGLDRRLKVVRSHRISRQTVLHTVLEGEARFLLVESKVHVSITPLDPSPIPRFEVTGE